MNRSSFGRDYSNYYSPTQFINAHRALPAGFARVDIPVKTFAAYGQSLAEADSSPVARTPRGFSIPVYHGSKTGPIAVAPRDKAKPQAPTAVTCAPLTLTTGPGGAGFSSLSNTSGTCGISQDAQQILPLRAWERL